MMPHALSLRALMHGVRCVLAACLARDHFRYAVNAVLADCETAERRRAARGATPATRKPTRASGRQVVGRWAHPRQLGRWAVGVSPARTDSQACGLLLWAHAQMSKSCCSACDKSPNALRRLHRYTRVL